MSAGWACAAWRNSANGCTWRLSGTQLTLVLLAAPAATAGAICLDRARGTLIHLLVTDLTDREIVLGKLAARLTPVMVLVAATLPVMELLSLLGGVDPDALVKAFVVTVGVGVLGCCLALVFSIWIRRTHEALLATYAVWGLWLLARPMLNEISRASGLTLIRPSLGGPILAGVLALLAAWLGRLASLPGLPRRDAGDLLRPGSARSLHDAPRLHA